MKIATLGLDQFSLKSITLQVNDFYKFDQVSPDWSQAARAAAAAEEDEDERESDLNLNRCCWTRSETEKRTSLDKDRLFAEDETKKNRTNTCRDKKKVSVTD